MIKVFKILRPALIVCFGFVIGQLIGFIGK